MLGWCDVLMPNMSVVESQLEIQHKRQQSHDSGTYQDWPHEEIRETSYNSNVTGEFVTVVAVETAENTPSPVEKPFVTVLSIDPLNQPETEEVLVYRLPGERLGFGLKFEGGVKTVEKVVRLYIQSCAADSPASRTLASWGPLAPGDEILAVDGVLVSDMTRIDCVRALKESHVVIKLQMRRGKDPKLSKLQQQQLETQAPPIPPRKFPRKKETIDPPLGFDDKKGSPPVVPRCRTNVPQAEIYTDILSQESLIPAESESDDTGSSISTVVSRISSTPTTSNSSFSDARSITSMDANVTSPPTPTPKNTPFDLDKVLEPFLQLEREFSSNTIHESSIFSKLVEASTLIDTKEESTLKPPENFQDSDAEQKDAPELPPKPCPRLEIDTTLKLEKRRPPPPPPRNDRQVCPNPIETASASRLPRLIDFVPKDRTDLVVPSPLHATDTSTKPVIVGSELKERGADDEAPSEIQAETPGLLSHTGPDSGSAKPIEPNASCNVHNSCADRILGPELTEQFHTLPSYSRLPPDGHEFPVHYEENLKRVTTTSKSLPVPTSKPFINQNLDVTRKTSLPCSTDSYKHALWRNDEKSERSVRDKIAMFSTVNNSQPTAISVASQPQLKKLNKFKSSDDVSSSHPLASSPKVAVTSSSAAKITSPIKKGLLPYHSLLDVTSDFGGELIKHNSARTQSTTDLSSVDGYEIDQSKMECSTLPRKHEQKSSSSGRIGHTPSLTRAVSFSGTTKLHSRSQSLTDVGARAQLFNCKSTEEARRSSLHHLIEQRKKSMSKLRGLVIPEKVLEVPTPKLVVDLPEIQSKDCPIPSLSEKIQNKVSYFSEAQTADKRNSAPSSKTIPVMPVPPWRAEATTYDLPKYSPAFKRKSLALYYGAPSSVSSVSSSLSSSREELRSCFSDSPKPNASVVLVGRNVTPSRNPLSSPHNYSEPKSLESITSPSMSDLIFEYASSASSPSLRLHPELSNKSNPVTNKTSLEIRTAAGGGGEEESDNDSAVSSSRSSVSHGYTPPHSPMPSYLRQDGGSHNAHSGLILKRTLSSETTASTSSNGSTLTSGSQASCSSNSSVDSRRVLKPQSVEAINRKNVLSSAKYSCGLDVKSSSPTVNNNLECNEYPTCTTEEVHNNITGPKSVSPATIIENIVVDPEDLFDDKVGAKDQQINVIREINETTDVPPDENLESKTEPSLEPTINDFFLENINKSDIGSSYPTEDSSLATNSSISPDEPDSASAKDSVDSFDSNKSLQSSNEWEDKDSPPSPKQPHENGIGKCAESRLPRAMKLSPTQKSISVNSIKKVFEKVDTFSVPNGRLKNNGLTVNTNIQHPRVSSIDSTTSDDSYIHMPNTPFGSISNLQKEQQFGSITSLASSTSLISQQELAQLIEEANHNLEDGGNSHEVIVVILHRDTPGGSIGITLAGGADYEAKEITVHKVLQGSPAERDGRIQKGDRILSINGKSMKGLTHYESLAILKAPRPEVVLVVSRHKIDTPEEIMSPRSALTNSRLSRYIEPKYTPSFDKGVDIKWGPIVTIELIKDGAGLGFSLEGGKDSPFGDQPLTVKKIFTGGCAEKCGLLYAGDELLSVNNIDLSELSRIEAWALMKRLPDGKVHLNIRHPLT